MYCKKCGKEIKGKEKFCPYCGEKIENNEEEERKVDEQKLDEQRIEKGQSNEENNQSVKQSHKVKTRKQFTVGKIIGIAAMLVIIGIGIYSQVKDEAPVDPSEKQEEKKNTAQDKKTDTKAKAAKNSAPHTAQHIIFTHIGPCEKRGTCNTATAAIPNIYMII